MSNAQLETAIEAAWEARDTITPATRGETRDAIEETLEALDKGKLRVAVKQPDNSWHVNQWAKKAVLLGFRLNDMEKHPGGPQGAGALWHRAGAPLKAVQYGGGQERGLRSGTENVAAIAGFGAAVDAAIREVLRRIRRSATSRFHRAFAGG